MSVTSVLLLLTALVCFGLAAFRIGLLGIDPGWVGFALLVLAWMFDDWEDRR